MRYVAAAIMWMGCCAVLGGSAPAQPSPNIRIVREQLRAAKASAVLLDWQTGRVLAVEGEERSASPGSLLKPFLLAYALQHGIVRADTRVYCRRNLRVAGRSLPCAHPADQPSLDAQGALAASCNTWFASLARRMTSQDMQTVLRQADLPFREGRFGDADSRVLTALGLENVTATPMGIAVAYRGLLLRESHTGVVWNGLRESVAHGMAGNARVRDVEVLGKTGTATRPGEWWTHGWFAGGVPGRFVLVVYLSRGDGGIAAKLAGTALQTMLREAAR